MAEQLGIPGVPSVPTDPVVTSGTLGGAVPPVTPASAIPPVPPLAGVEDPVAREALTSVFQSQSALEAQFTQVLALLTTLTVSVQSLASVPRADPVAPRPSSPTQSRPQVPLDGMEVDSRARVSDGARPRSPTRTSLAPPQGLLPLEEAARIWALDRSACRLHSDFRRLGPGRQAHVDGRLPYYLWQTNVLAALEAANFTSVLFHPPPTASDPDVLRDYYRIANAQTYQRLLASVSDVPVLCDVVHRQQYSDMGSARASWTAIHEHCVRTSPATLSYLQGKLHQLAPTGSETMESFLNRCNKLREEYRTHGFTLSSSDLVIQVFSRIDATWRSSPGLPRDGATPIQSLPWEDVSFSLITEDSQRRQSSITSSTMLLPLGGSRSGQAMYTDGPDPPPQGPPYGGAALAGSSRPPPRSQSPSRRVAPRRDMTQGPGGTTSATPAPQRVPSVCWICLGVGHEFKACPDLRGRTTFTAESRAEAERIRARLRAEMRATAALAAGAGTPTPGAAPPVTAPPSGFPPSDGRASAAL